MEEELDLINWLNSVERYEEPEATNSDRINKASSNDTDRAIRFKECKYVNIYEERKQAGEREACSREINRENGKLQRNT